MKHNWVYKRLGDICDVIGGSTPNTEVSEYWNGTLNWFTPAEISDKKYYSVSARKITEAAVKAIGLNILPPGTVLLTSRAPIGKVGITTSYSYCNQGFKNLVCKKGLFNEYLYYALIYFNDDIKEKGRGVTFKEISKKVTENISIPVPPMEVQEQIVAELDKINEVIADCRELLRNLDALAQSLFYDFFGDPISNPKGYNIVPLSEVFTIITDGTHQTPTYTTDIKNGVKFLSAKDVVNGYIDWSNIKYIPKELHIELHKRLAPQRGDILLCKNGTTGICALVETDEIFDIYVSLALLRPQKNLNAKFLVYAINNPFTKEQFNHSLKGIGVPNLHLNKIRNTKIVVPPLALQEKFAARIEQIEEQKKAVEQTIAELQTLLDSRMDYWFN